MQPTVPLPLKWDVQGARSLRNTLRVLQSRAVPHQTWQPHRSHVRHGNRPHDVPFPGLPQVSVAPDLSQFNRPCSK